VAQDLLTLDAMATAANRIFNVWPQGAGSSSISAMVWWLELSITQWRKTMPLAQPPGEGALDIWRLKGRW
jgi:hypothetical protein